MDTFHTLLAAIKNDCACEQIPTDKIATLARMCGPEEIAQLIQELDELDDADLENDPGDGIDEYWRLRTSLSQVLAQVCEPAVLPLIQALKRNNPQTRGYAANALGMIGAKQAFEPILTLLEAESDFNTKLSLIDALGKIGDPRAVNVLLRYLQAPEQQNRGWLIRITANALGRIGTAAVLQPLREVLESDSDWFARLGAAEGLGHLREEGAIGGKRSRIEVDKRTVRRRGSQSDLALSQLGL
jgi:HEAT repeat protein